MMRERRLVGLEEIRAAASFRAHALFHVLLITGSYAKLVRQKLWPLPDGAVVPPKLTNRDLEWAADLG